MTARPKDLPEPALRALTRGRVIEAVAIVERTYDVSLKEAGRIVDRFLEARPEIKARVELRMADARAGFLKLALLLAAVIAAVLVYRLKG